jgi:hypothetical protein
MFKIWRELSVRGRLEVGVHILGFFVLAGYLYFEFQRRGDAVEQLQDNQEVIEEDVTTLQRKTDDIGKIEERLDRIVENQDKLRALLIEYIRDNTRGGIDNDK